MQQFGDMVEIDLAAFVEHDGKSVSKLFRGVDPQYAPPPVPGEGA